jgi:hypothetical protein
MSPVLGQVEPLGLQPDKLLQPTAPLNPKLVGRQMWVFAAQPFGGDPQRLYRGRIQIGRLESLQELDHVQAAAFQTSLSRR